MTDDNLDRYKRVKAAMRDGAFDDLPGKGRPIDVQGYFDLPEHLRVSHPLQLQLGRLQSLLGRRLTMSSAAWSAATPYFAYRSFPAGEHVIAAGEGVSKLGFLVSGLARYYYLSREGKEFNKAFALPGNPLTSIIALVTGQPSPFYIQTLADSECLFLPYEKMILLCDRHPEWALLGRYLLEQLAIKKERREADFLLLSAQERYEKFLVEYRDVVDRLPNYHIASYLGITEVGLSRIRRRLGMTASSGGKV